MILGASLLPSQSIATTLIFEADNGALSGQIQEDYGDRITSTVQGGLTYEIGPEGTTSNVVVTYSTGESGPLTVFEGGYGDLLHVLAAKQEPSVMELTLTADPGFNVRLHGFELAGWPQRNYQINGVEILNEQDKVLFSAPLITVNGTGPSHSDFLFGAPIQANALKIRVDPTNLGGNADNIGIDNITFSQAPEDSEPLNMVSQLAFSNAEEGDQDVTEFVEDESVFITLSDIDMPQTSEFTHARASIIQGDIDVSTTLQPRNDGTFRGEVSLKPFDSGEEVQVVVLAFNQETGVHLVRVSNIFIMRRVVTVRLSSSSEDAEESLADGSVNLESSDLELSEDRGTPQILGMRFTGIDLPKKATISAAYVQFTADERSSEDTVVTIVAEATGNAAPLSNTAGNISSRIETPLSQEWTIPPWETRGESGLNQRTPDISHIIQSIVDREDWERGNALMIRMDGEGHRVAESWDGDENAAPLLHIEFSLPEE